MKHNYILTVLALALPFATTAQSLTGASPNQGTQGQTLSVSVSGQNTSFGQGTSTTVAYLNQGSSQIWFQSLNIVNNTVVSGTLSIQNSDPAGFYNVNVNNSIDGQMLLPSGFEVLANPNPPQIILVDPDSGAQGANNLQVDITGQNTSFTQGSNTVWFTQGTSTVLYPYQVNMTSDTDAETYVNIPINQPTGLYDVHVHDDIDGTVTKPNGFTVYPFNVSTNDIEEQKALQFEAYPNPLEAQLTLDYSLEKEDHVFIDIYDATGKQVSVLLDARFAAGNYKRVVDVGSLELGRGVYFVRMKVGVKERVLRVVR